MSDRYLPARVLHPGAAGTRPMLYHWRRGGMEKRTTHQEFQRAKFSFG